MQEISRPGPEMGKLAHRFESAIAVGAQLTVASSEKVAFVLAGSVVGLVKAGQYHLDPQSLPFLEMCVQGDQIEAELHFITNSLQDMRFGGELRTFYNPETGEPYAPRCFGSYSLYVADIKRLFAAGLVSEPDQGQGLVKARILEGLSQVLTQVGPASIDAKDPNVLAELAQRTQAELKGKLADYGLAVEISLAGVILAPG